jgi:hypothetical protein
MATAERISELEMRGLMEEKKSPSRPLPPPISVEDDVAQKFLQEDRQSRS